MGAKANVYVAPPADASQNGDFEQYLIFGSTSPTPVTFQWDLAASQLTPLVGTTLSGIGFRLPASAPTWSTDSYFPTFDLELSGSANPIGSLSSDQASNIGANAATVYNTSLDIPANSFVGGAGPNPFYFISFTTPYTYVGGDLLLTLTRTGDSGPPVDANLVSSSGDTSVSAFGGSLAQWYNYPITAFEYTTLTPEPGYLVLLGVMMALLFVGVRRLSRSAD